MVRVPVGTNQPFFGVVTRRVSFDAALMRRVTDQVTVAHEIMVQLASERRQAAGEALFSRVSADPNLAQLLLNQRFDLKKHMRPGNWLSFDGQGGFTIDFENEEDRRSFEEHRTQQGRNPAVD